MDNTLFQLSLGNPARDGFPASVARSQSCFLLSFVRRTVQRSSGRVKYWQCENEPSNAGLLWAGTADEYVRHLRAFHAQVRSADPDAAVVLGGCGYDVLSSSPASEQQKFFDYVLSAGRDAFDLFDIHLYGDPYQIPRHLARARQMMKAQGYEKPIVAGEHAGPSLFEFPEAEAAIQEMLGTFLNASPVTQSTEELTQDSGPNAFERSAMLHLYERKNELPPKLRIFMAGCPADLEEKRWRIACRQLVMRNVMALSEGVRRTLYWNLGPEMPGPLDPYRIMHLLIFKLPLLQYTGDSLQVRIPTANTFGLLTTALKDCAQVARVQIAGEPAVFAFEIGQTSQESMLVVWDRRDPFDGEDAPAREVKLPWRNTRAEAIDVFGNFQPLRYSDGFVQLRITDTPVFVSERRLFRDGPVASNPATS